MTIMRTYKIRLLPTKEQEMMFYKHIGCCRFIWNWALDKQIKYYKEENGHYTAFDLINMLTDLRHDNNYSWLNEVSDKSLGTICRDLDKSYKDFFKGVSGHPKFKSKKRSKMSFPARQDSIYFSDDFVQISKVGKVKYKTNYNIETGKGTKFYNPRIFLKNNKWILAVGYKCESQAVELTNKSIGIDLGVKVLATVAHGDECIVFKNINKTATMKKLNKKLKRLRKKQHRKYRTNKSFNKTSNILKTERQIREISYHIANIRNNYIHQTTHRIAELLPHRVVMEDLNVIGMLKNKHLSRAISEQCFHEFTRQMSYKCEERGIEFVKANRFYPSSKTCSSCGNIKHDLKLSDRIYICEHCGNVIDRDYNAAINLMQYTA